MAKRIANKLQRLLSTARLVLLRLVFRLFNRPRGIFCLNCRPLFSWGLANGEQVAKAMAQEQGLGVHSIRAYLFGIFPPRMSPGGIIVSGGGPDVR